MKFRQIRSALCIVEFAGVRFLIDPMLGDKYEYPPIPMTVNCAPGTPTSDLPVPVESLFDVDAVIATHLHFDHFDEAAKARLPKSLPIFAQSEAEAAIIRSWSFEDVRVLSAEGVEFKGVRLCRTECEHGRSDLVMADAYQKVGMSAEACGVVFESVDPALEASRFYLAGDTVYCKAVETTIERLRPGIVAVNAAGAQFPRGHTLIMNEYDVLDLMSRFPAIDVVATHMDGVSHATVSSDDLRAFRKAHGLSKLHVPSPDETLEFTRGPLEA